MKFKKGDKVALKEKVLDQMYYPDNIGFYIKDILVNDLPYPIVVGRESFGKDWVEFFNEDEIILKGE